MALRNWDEIRRSYVEGHVVDGKRVLPSLEDLSTIFGVPASSIRKRSMAERWAEQRNNFRTLVEQQRQDSAARTIAEEGAKTDISAHIAARRLIAQVTKHLDLAEQKQDPIGADKLQSLMRTVALGQQVDQLAGGRPTTIQERHLLSQNEEVCKWRPMLERMDTAAIERQMAAREDRERALREVQAERDSKLH